MIETKDLYKSFDGKKMVLNGITEKIENGELDKLKIENMLEQNRALMKKYEDTKKHILDEIEKLEQ